MAYTFDKSLETGNAMIDSQHRQLIDAINSLMAACSQGKGRQEIDKIARFLEDYTAKHFGDEEKLQMQSRYPDYVNHKRYHETFKKVVHEISSELSQKGPSVALVSKVNTSIGGWLVNHITKEDVKVAAHLRTAKPAVSTLGARTPGAPAAAARTPGMGAARKSYTFTSDLATGNTMIDTQHKQLFTAINNLLDACSKGNGRQTIETTCHFLENYTTKHFGDEEKLQQQSHYPDYLNHKKYHDQFKKTVKEISMELSQKGPSILLVNKITTSVGNWLVSHIKQQDMKVVAHLQKSQKK